MTDLKPSKLGTKEYWDKFYEQEKENFAENKADTGESWFSDFNAEDKMVDFLVGKQEEGELSGSETVLELGSGNGRLLFALRDGEFSGKFTGLDYSLAAVEFAKSVAAEEGYSEGIDFVQANFLNDDSWTSQKYDIILDKGTLDAIALSSDKYENDTRTAVQQYVVKVKGLLQDKGLLLITSCNFTQDELIKTICEGGFTVSSTVDYPTFEFGGRKGQPICTVAFVHS